jgi:predicted dehydrogenase
MLSSFSARSELHDVPFAIKLRSSEYHVKHAVQSLEAGKHVFIEKPMALTVQGTDEIEAVRVKSGKVVFVGYMRRYSPAFLLVRDLVRALPSGSINYGEWYRPVHR